MGDVLFWLFMLVMALLIPGCMLFFGHRLQTRPPRDINSAYGYRSARSMGSQEAWDFAQACSGRFWVRAAKPTLAVSMVWMLLLFGRDIDTVGIAAAVLTGIQILPFLAVIPVTERALKRAFEAPGSGNGGF